MFSVLRILLVEDNPGDAFLTQKMLSMSTVADAQLTHVDCLHETQNVNPQPQVGKIQVSR